MLRRVLTVVICALALASCRLDVEVSVVIEPDGTGTVTVVALADEGLVEQVPELQDALVFDDAIEAGWTVEGPTPTAEGGFRMVLTHPFSSDQELANVLNSIGPPLLDMRAGRITVDDQTTNEIDGRLELPDGFESFADADLIEAVGGLPFADRFEETGAMPDEVMSFTFRASMPGEVISATGVELSPGLFEWEALLDGSSVQVSAATVQRPADDGAWARALSTAAAIALVVWVVLSIVLITAVAIARQRRSRRRRDTSRSPAGRRRAP